MGLGSPKTSGDYWGYPAHLGIVSLTEYSVGAYDLISGYINWLVFGI